MQIVFIWNNFSVLQYSDEENALKIQIKILKQIKIYTKHNFSFISYYILNRIFI